MRTRRTRNGQSGCLREQTGRQLPLIMVPSEYDTAGRRHGWNAHIAISVLTEQSGAIDRQSAISKSWADYKRPGSEISWYTDEGISGARRSA